MDKIENSTQINKLNVDKIIMYIILIMLAIIPIVIYKIRIWGIGPEILNSVYDTKVKNEFFNYSKFVLLQFFTILIAILFMYRIYIKKVKLKITKINTILLIIVMPVIISSVTSEYNYIALMGNSERFEGALTWIYYFIIFFVIYNIQIDKKYYKLFYLSLTPFLIVNTTLGLLNLYNINVLKIEPIYKLLGSNSEISGKLITTLYNQNFSSGVGAVIFIGTLMHILLTKNKKLRIYSLFMLAMSFSIILTSMSLSGFVTIVFLSPIVVLASTKFNSKVHILRLTSLALIICSMIYIPLSNHDERVYNESVGFFVRITNSLQVKDESKEETPTSNKNLAQELVSAGSGRVDIWKETIKLISDRPILGYGFDTMPYVMDQDNHGFYNTIVDKPHNWYFTVMYGCGIFGLLGLMSIIIWISKSVIKRYNQNIEQKEIYIFFTMIIAYSFQGLFNDSFIGTSILFWVFGGIVVNLLENQMKEV